MNAPKFWLKSNTKYFPFSDVVICSLNNNTIPVWKPCAHHLDRVPKNVIKYVLYGFHWASLWPDVHPQSQKTSLTTMLTTESLTTIF